MLSRHVLFSALVSIAALSACTTNDRSTGLLPTEALLAKGGPPQQDPSATWKIPLADAGLSLRSDQRFGDGTYSVYAPGVCGVGSNIFVGSGASGDAILQTTYPKGNRCGRMVTMVYPDAGQETLATFMNLNKLQRADPSNVIPVGGSDYRRLIVGFANSNNPNTGRCGRVIFGDNGMVGAGTDMLLVTRLSATTWWVRSDPGSLKRAFCETLNVIYENMNVDFVVESSYALPG